MGFRQNDRYPFKRIIPVLVVSENLLTLYSPDHDVVQYAGRV